MEMALTDLVPTDLVPWGRGSSVPARRFDDSDMFVAPSREMNRVLDTFTRGLGTSFPTRFGPSGAWPHVAVNESETAVTVKAGLPGIDEKEVEVSLHDGVLTLKGEKKSETSGAVYTERWHGQFQRSVQVGPDIDPEQVSASFKNGMLTVTMAKRPEMQRSVRRIPISAS
jgi:HSP20 family protein